MHRRLLFVSFFVFLSVIIARAQTRDPIIGQPFTNYTFANVHYHTSRSMSTDEFKGKWLILDFWDEFCAGCVASFPSVNNLQKEFGNQVKFVLVGYNGNSGSIEHRPSQIEGLFEKLHNKMHLNLPIAYDSTLYNRFEIGGVGCPYIIIVNPEGQVAYLTGHLNEKDVLSIVEGHQVELEPILRVLGTGFKFVRHPVNSDSNLLYENSISKWKPEADVFQMRPDLPSDTATTNWFQILGMQLDYFYRFAYTGLTEWDNPSYAYYSTFKFYPVLEINDSSNFDHSKRYTFELKSPVGLTKEQVISNLKQSLFDCFRFKVRIESRIVPYWSISLVDSSVKKLLISKGAETSFEINNGSKFLGFTMVNVPISKIVQTLFTNFQLHTQGYGSGLPFIDNTGIMQNIDLKLDAIMSNFDDVKRALLENGIELKKKEKSMPCIVISDK
jgi:thiol-disulfide isomerase/thioredoxin